MGKKLEGMGYVNKFVNGLAEKMAWSESLNSPMPAVKP